MITAQDDRHLVCMAMMDRTGFSTVLSGHWSITKHNCLLTSEGWAGGLHAVALAYIVQKPPTPQTAMGSEFSVFGQVPLQLVLQ